MFARNSLIGTPIAMPLALLLCLCPAVHSEDSVDFRSKLKARMKLRTPVNDELLHELEQDFVDLLKESKHAEALLEAEELLIATNDNTHWTNYSAATKLLRRDRDLAAIPLLLRYVVVHSRRSSHHVMIPEYRKTISAISGHELAPIYAAGPNLEARMREKVLDIVNVWWRKEKDNLSTDPGEMSPEQLQVLVNNMLQQVRYNGDFTGSGGAHDSAYGAYHNVYYDIQTGSPSDRHEISPIHPNMIPLVLAPSGYPLDPAPDKRFPYEAIVILAEFVKNGHQATIQEIANEPKQNATVRMVCVFALFRANHEFQTDTMIQLLPDETDLERRLIILLSLRWGGPKATPVLLKHMDDPNMEIATVAGCALRDTQPPEAMPKFQKLLDRHHVSMPLLLMGAMAEYKTPQSRALLTRLLTDAVEGRKNSQHLSRILDDFADGWEIPRTVYRRDDDRDYKRQAKLALAYSRQMVLQQQAEQRKLEAVVESLRMQLKVAQEIEVLRRAEYKRLLALQGDEVVTAQASQQAYTQVQSVTAEVKELRASVAEHESKLEAMRSK